MADVIRRQLAENVTVYLADCLDVLPELSGLDAVVTDPPYGLSFMGKRWDYDVPDQAIWEACLAAMKPGAHLLSFAGTRTQHRMAVRIEDAGFDIRDMIAWVYGSGFPKSHNLDGDKKGWGTALKPALEPITVARKPLIGTVADNVLAHGTGALNIDGCRVGNFQNTTPSGVDRRNAKLAEMGYRPSEYQMGTKLPDTPPGRWPANLIHDGSEDVTGLFPGAEDQSAARFFYCAKASNRDRDEGLDGFEKRENANWPQSMDGNDKRGAAPRANIHPTVKPTALMRYLCRLVTPPDGVVLDLFMGSGSTGKAAVLEGFGFIGIERDETYFDISCRRIEAALKVKSDDLLGRAI